MESDDLIRLVALALKTRIQAAAYLGLPLRIILPVTAAQIVSQFEPFLSRKIVNRPL